MPALSHDILPSAQTTAVRRDYLAGLRPGDPHPGTWDTAPAMQGSFGALDYVASNDGQKDAIVGGITPGALMPSLFMGMYD